MQIALTVKEERFVKAMEAMAGSVGKLSAELNFKLAKSLKEADAVSRQFAQGFGKVGDKMQSFGQNMSMYVTAPLTLMAGAALNAYGELDSLERSLLTVEGTSENLEKRLVELREAAKLPGLGFQEAIKGDVALRSVGIAATTSLKILKEFGNANAMGGGGKEQLSSIITQLSQMSAKGKVLSEDLKPIITAAPTVAKALKEMFGTVDSGDIQKKLEGAGKNSQDFIEMLLTILEKAPRVTGGFKNAIENVKDSLFKFSANMGKALDKAFDFEGIVNSISAALNSAQNYFNSLSPEIQKTIFAVGGLVAVVGPLLVAIGGIIAISGPVIAAIAGISLPMIAVGAIVVSFTATVIRNWGEIEAVLKDTGVWTVLAETVKFTVGVIGEAFALLFNALTGDWSNFGERLTNIAKRLWNAQLDIIQLFINETLNMIQSFWSIFGGTNYITQAIERVKKNLGSFVSKITADVPQATNYLQKLNEQLTGLGTSGGGKTGGNVGGGGGKGKEDKFAYMDAEWMKTLNRKVANSLGDLKELSYSDYFKNELAELQKLIGKPVDFQITWADNLVAASKRLKDGMPKIMSVIGVSAEASFKKDVLDRMQKAFSNLGNLDTSAILNLPVLVAQQLNFSIAGAKIDSEIKKNLDISEKINNLNKTADMSNFLTQQIEGAIEGVAQAVGEGGGLKNVFSKIMGIVGDFMIQLGKKLFTINTIVVNALNSIGGPAGIAISLGLIVAGSALKSQSFQGPKFADGGMVLGPTFAMMGDNASGREMALPWEKTGVFAQAIAANIGGGGAGVGGNVNFRLRGEDLFGALQQYMKNNGIKSL